LAASALHAQSGPDDASRAETTPLPQLAETGQFRELLQRLRSDYGEQGGLDTLIAEIERYQSHQAERLEKRQTEYDEALAEAAERTADERFEEALVSAIEARTLAADPDDLLSEESVEKLVERSEDAAEAAEAEGDWLAALSHYQLLARLYDDRATYRDDLDRASQHVRMLRLYAPAALEALYEARAEELETRAAESGEQDAPEEEESPASQLPDVEEESWQERLKGVTRQMLRDAMRYAVAQHISDTEYGELVRGAVDNAVVLARTEALKETFTSYDDEEAVNAFREQIEKIRQSLGERGKLSFLDAERTIDRVLATNRQTVDLPESVLLYELAEGAMGTLDEFTGVIWPHDLEQFSRSTQGRFTGVGIRISREHGELTVDSPILGTPAYEAGIKAEDVIAEVDSRPTTRWSLERAVREITGPEGTIVTLGIRREGREGLIEFPVRRSNIEIESILGWKHDDGGGWDYFIDPEQRIGYVRMSQFLPQTADDLDVAISGMQEDGPINGLILDLRLNPGGLLQAAIDVTDRFVGEGPIVYTANAEGEPYPDPHKAHRHRTYPDFPIVVLINEGSASASEIVSGALQDYGRATVIGTRSFGKGSVQDIVELDRRRAWLKLTTRYYMLPLGRIIHRQPDAPEWGIEPDLTVEMTPQQMADAMELRQEVDVLHRQSEHVEDQPEAEEILTQGVDPQLEAALLVLKTRVIAGKLGPSHVASKSQ
ncbi:MAG: S41 family peptidase, partial [Phycisphaeraceae bacterium]